MPFDSNQPNHVAFRDIIAQRTQQVVVVVGSGASANPPAELPVWPALKTMLLAEANAKTVLLEHREKNRVGSLINAAEQEPDYWQAFSHLKKALGETSYRQAILKSFLKADNASPPEIYEKIWRMGVSGIVTTNIDRFAARSFAEVFKGRPLVEFSGYEVGNYNTTFRSGTPFVANLHGVLANDSSWIFTCEDLQRLRTPAFKHFFSQCFSGRTLLFVGISVDDYAISSHLERLKSDGINFGAHYWLTHRNDQQTNQFSESNGLLRICYNLNQRGNTHAEVNDFFLDIERYNAHDPVPPIVVPDTKRERNIDLPDPAELSARTAEDIRLVLNQEAVRILKSNSANKAKEYNDLLQKYDECIYRLWRVKDKPPGNILFGYEIKAKIGKGGFGNVFEAISPDGERVAIKVLLEAVREDPSMLDSFRRGVQAMRLLSNREVSGIVPYRRSWELPACMVMDYIGGYNLEEAVTARFVREWKTKFRIAVNLVSIIRNAHLLPEHVLHRDIRPANIMLKNFHSPDDLGEWEVMVLDFDLCWHKDAVGDSVQPDSVTIAYHAPEQFQHFTKASRRSALVDSFGLGMTMFFLFSGVHPQPYCVQNDEEWQADLKNRIKDLASPYWTSLPTRLSRLIYNATRKEQLLRWDLTKILGELLRLKDCLFGDQFKDAEMLAEEIASRSQRMKDYTWNEDKRRAVQNTVTGFELSIWGNEGDQKIEASIGWSNQGDRDFSTVKKYILPNVDKVVSELKGAGWNAAIVNRRNDQVDIEASIALNRIKSPDVLDKLSKGFTCAVNHLKLM